MIKGLVAWLFFNTGTLNSRSTVVNSVECTREALEAHVGSYLSAQTSGIPSFVLALSYSNFSYSEDFLPRDPSKGILSLPLRIDHNRSIIDTTQCATYTELIVTDLKNPRVIGTQMRYNKTSGELIKMESLVTQAGDWAFNASQTLRYAASEDGKWGIIPEEDRDSRAVIQAAADAYLDLFNNKSVTVPWGVPCQRLEGGAYTGRGLPTDSCDVGVPSGVVIKDRRYVIDEALGTVDAMVLFQTRPDSHEFRVEKGKLRFVHTMTVMRNVTIQVAE
jgi:hypothetical protein